VNQIRVAFSDFIRRIGVLLRRDAPHEPGARGVRSAQRQPGDATVLMGSSGAAHPADATPPAAPVRQPAGSASAEPTVLAPRPPAHSAEAAPPPPTAETPPAQTVPQAPPRPTPGQPAAGGEIDALAATRVIGAAEEEPLGRVVGVLVAVEGELEGTLAPVVSGSNRLGRHPECEVCLPSEWISRHHARIEYQRGIFLIEASSDKATTLNSERLERGELHDGDTIALGKTTLRFRTIL
jgi:hypothetical protein